MEVETVYYPVRFFAITFAITWICGFIAAYFSFRPGMQAIQLLFMLPGLFAPTLAVLCLVGGARNKALRQDFWARLSLKKIEPGYLAAILLIMPFAVLLATGLSVLFGGSATQFELSSGFTIMQGQLALSLLIMFLAPTLEELGWRGYGVDSLMSRYSLIKTTAMFAVLWGLWHLPLFFTNGYYQHELWRMGWVYVANFFAQVCVATILMNWMYYKNNRSISAAILFHFTFVLFSELLQTEPVTKCIVTLVLLLISIAIVARNKEFFFAEKAIRLPRSSQRAAALQGSDVN
jgi:membrane protease YdiL (CAAX protease family)